MKKNNYSNFKEMAIEDEIRISAAGGSGLNISSIISGVTSSISNLVNIADDVSDTVIKNKIVAKMDEVEKGEISLDKNGSIKLKWDSLSNKTNQKMSIIF